MARLGFSLSLLALSLTLLSSTPTSNGYLQDFNRHYRNWARNFVGRQGRWMWFADAYAKHREMAHYQQYKINVELDNVQYSTATRDLEKPRYVMSHWVYNSGNDEIITKVSQSVSMSSSFSWSVTEGLKLGVSTKVSAGIPGILNVEVGGSFEISLSSTQGKTTATSHTQMVEDTIKVPPKTSLKWTITSTDHDVTVPWTADVFIGGSIAVWAIPKWRGHWLYFYPAAWFTGNGFTRVGNRLRYRARGNFKGVRGIESSLTLRYCDYHTQQTTGRCVTKNGEEAKPVLYKTFHV